MRRTAGKPGAGAFSLLELLCVIAIIGLLAALLLPALNQAKARAKRIQCVENLHQLGIAFQSFAHDHNDQFPMAVPAASGGSLEFSQAAYLVQGQFYLTFRHFQALSNDLASPAVLVCPADTRAAARDFASMSNSNLSYFLVLNAAFNRPEGILAGDRNLTNNYTSAATIAFLGTASSLHWTREMHQFKGNVLYSEGRVAEQNSPELMAAASLGHGAYNLAMPTSPVGGTAGSILNGGYAAVPPSGNMPAAFPENRPVPAPPGGRVGQSSTSPGATGVNSSRQNFGQTIAAGANPSVQPAAPSNPSNVSTNAPSTREPSSPEESTDPGFSFFPYWMSGPDTGMIAGGMWLLALLLLALLLVMLARHMTRPKRTRGTERPRRTE